MKTILPCLSMLVISLGAIAATAQNTGSLSAVERPPAEDVGPGTTDQGPLTVGDRLLLHAITQLERRETLTARLRHQAHLDGRELHGTGSYWQQGRGESLRVRLELQIAGQEASTVQVSNGRFLWSDQRLPTGRIVSRIDLRQLRADPLLSAAANKELPPGQASWSSIQPEMSVSNGGLPMLLASLSEHFVFMPPQAMRLTFSPPLVTQTTSIPVFAVVGHWKQDRLAELLKSEKKDEEGRQTASPLPPRLPQEVLLLVGQADLFPYRIEYRRDASSTSDPTAPYELSTRPMVVLELSDVRFDVAIAPSLFDYTPGEAQWSDRTAELMQRLRRSHEQRVAGSATEQR
jgi:hypothetical protein